MTRQTLIMAVCLIALAARGTHPWPAMRVYRNDGRLLGTLNPDWDRALVLSLPGEDNKPFSIRDLFKGEDWLDDVRFSTAGAIWYENAIAFTDSHDEFLVVRLKSKKVIVVDLTTREILWLLPEKIKEDALSRMRKEAFRLLASHDPHELETGAMLCGQLVVRDAIPGLRKLLADSTYFTTWSGDGPYRNVYYVRKAAAEALQSMGEQVPEVTVEVVTEFYDPPRR